MPQIPVMDLMTRQIPTVVEDASLQDVAIALLEQDASEVYVVNRGGVLKGVIPDYEVLKAQLCGTAPDTSIANMVSRTPQTIAPQASAVAIASLFRDGFRSALAVIDHQGRLIGQLKRREVIWLLTIMEDSESTSTDPVPASEENRVPEPNFLRKRRILAQQIAKEAAHQDLR
ncbi:MAG: CBS domain-containing protein [Planctomycetaceae bacterium]